MTKLKIYRKKTLGIEVPYYHTGENESTAIIFLHGNRGSGLMFRSVLTSGLSRKYTLIAPDLPGFGDCVVEDQLLENISWDFLKEVVVEFSNSFSFESIVLCGHSMGGHLAIESINHIKASRGIVIFGTPPVKGMQDLPNAFLPNPNMELLLKAEISDSDIDQLIAGSTEKQTTKEFLKAIVRKAEPNVLKNIYESITYQIEDEVNILSSLRSFPICCIHVKNDPLINYQYLVDIGFGRIFFGQIAMAHKLAGMIIPFDAIVFNEPDACYFICR